VVRTANNGVTTTHPLFSISLQHPFFSVPGLLCAGRHGMIQGHIFRDDDSAGLYNPQASTLSGVEVRLDENASPGRTPAAITHSIMCRLACIVLKRS